jgi:predicted amidohydrolase YtcJ
MLHIILILFVFILVGCQSSLQRADTVLLSGKIHTMNDQMPMAEAIAFKDGIIVAVGSNQQILSWRGPNTVTYDLAGNSALPGLIDSHIHTIEGATALKACSMDDEKLTMIQLGDKIRNCIQQQPEPGWLQVLNVRSVGLTLNKQDLDAIAPNSPLFLVSTDGHTAWSNSTALNIAGITDDTLSPLNGKIVHDNKGHVSGLLIDGATSLVSEKIPAMPISERVATMELVLQQLYKAGITAFLEANSDASSVETFCALASKGKLKSKVTLALGSNGDPSKQEFARLLKLKRKAEVCGLIADTIKLYADGVMEYPIQSAALLRPYINPGNSKNSNKGALYLNPMQLKRFSKKALELGFSIHVHAIGDGAVRTVLDSFEYARIQQPNAKGRLSIAHLQLIDPQDYSRFKQLNVMASLQLLWAQPDEYSVDAVLPYIGETRHRRLYPARSLQQAGAILTGGSDWNVSSFNPFEAMVIGRSRLNPDYPQEPALNTNEGLSLHSLLKAYSKNAAILLGRDDEIGQLKVGMAADLIVLDRVVSEDISAKDLSNTQVLFTLINGEVVFQQPRP